MPDADYFAYNQYRDYIIYKELARTERVVEFRDTLTRLVDQEYGDYLFWVKFSRQKEFTIHFYDVLFFRLVRKVFGLTFASKFLEGREKKMIGKYSQYLQTVKEPEVRREIEAVVAHEREHESSFIAQIKEERVEFLGNVVLGLNDGLIELSGSLIGFSFAFSNPLTVALSGLIVGLSAALSMASSAYMQARHEEGRKPVKAAAYTGIAYLIVVIILTAPFFLFAQTMTALTVMILLVALIIVSLSLYSSVLFDRSFWKQAGEMATFSIGVALVSFAMGSLVKHFAPGLAGIQ